MSVLGGIHKRNGRVRMFSTQREAVEMQRQSSQLRESQISYISNIKGTMTETLIGLLMAALVVIIALILKIRRMVWLQRESDKQLKADVDKIEKDRTNLEECRSELEEITRGVQKVIDEFNIKYESMWRERNFDVYYIYKMKEMDEHLMATLRRFEAYINRKN